MTTTVVLISGLWDYSGIDSKKSQSNINILHNAELRAHISKLYGVNDVLNITYLDGTTQKLLFPNSTAVEPNLASTSLQQLIPEDFPVINISLASVASGEAYINCPPSSQLVFLLSTSYITNFNDLKTSIHAIRRLGPGLILAGGYLASRNPERCLQLGVDAVCSGDAERTLPDFLKVHGRKDKWQFIPNLVYLIGAETIRTHTAATKLDDIPLPRLAPDLANYSVPYESMRGCPYTCAFCSYPLVSDTWRYKSAIKIFNDFSELEQRGASRVIALDSTFTVPKTRLHEFLDHYIDNNLTIPWGAYSRTPELRDENLVSKLVKANCRWLSIGFESGSDIMLKHMNKKTTVLHSDLALENLKKYKLAPWSNFIIGYPGETSETIKETTSYIKNKIFGFYGLYVFNIRDRSMPVLSDPSFNVKYSDIDGEWEHSTMNSEEAVAARDKAYWSICAANQQAINIDVFRGSGVESAYTPWDSAFSTLKAIELESVKFVYNYDTAE